MINRLIIFLAIVILSGCESGNDFEKPMPTIIIYPHSSLGEFYQNIPVTFSFELLHTEPIEDVTWDFGDGRPTDLFNQHVFVDQGIYTIRVKVKSRGLNYIADTTINVVQAPVSYGLSGTREEALAIYKAGSDQYNVLVESNTGSSASDYYILKTNHNLEFNPSKAILNFGYYPSIGPYVSTSSGDAAIAIDTNIKLYAADGTLTATHYLGKYASDIRLVNNNEIMVLFDSSDFAVINSINQSTNKISRMRQSMDVNGMTRYGLFFSGDSALSGHYRNSTDQISLIMGSNLGGAVTFSQYFNDPIYVQDITPISTGLLINTAVQEDWDGKSFSLIKFGETNQVEWRKTFKENFNYFYGNISESKLVVKEVGEFLFIFFDNMRCVKLAQNGQIIWDRYFYPSIARFDDVVVTADGNFLLVGTRQYDTEAMEITGEYSKRDIIFVMITPDGERIIE